MNPCMKLATVLKEQGLLSVQVKEKLTVNSEVVVEDLEEWERVPSVSWLLAKHLIHVYCKQRPEDLCVLNQKITKPGERLTNKQFTTIIPHQNEPNHPSRKQCRFLHRISHSYQQYMNVNYIARKMCFQGQSRLDCKLVQALVFQWYTSAFKIIAIHAIVTEIENIQL